MGKEKAIISPVHEEGIGPRGFMESFQYVRCSKDSLEDALGEVAKVLDAAKLSRETQ